MLYRGDHPLPYLLDVDDDPDAEIIARHLGATAIGYRYRMRGCDHFAVFSCSSPRRWREFTSRQRLDAWLDAYGCTAEPENAAHAKVFRIHLPLDMAALEPLREGPYRPEDGPRPIWVASASPRARTEDGR